MTKKITIREVAEAAGVSLGTASRALNRAGRVSDEAIAAVTRAARRLGYAPDELARSMRTRQSGVVGMLVSDLSNPLYARIVGALEADLQQAGYALWVSSTHNDGERERSLIDLLRGRRVDGLVLGPCDVETPKDHARLGRDLPLVLLDRDLPPGVGGVHVDHRQGALQATRYLLDLGHVRIALLTPGSALRTSRERIAGFEDAHRERGLKPKRGLILTERGSMDFACAEAVTLLDAKNPPTAFVCLGTRLLAGALQALRQTRRAVGRDVSVISIGDTDLSRLFSPAITSLDWDLDDVGRSLARLLLARLDRTRRAEPERVEIGTHLLLRESCARVA